MSMVVGVFKKGHYMPKNVKLLIARQFPLAVLTRCKRDYDCTFNPEDTDWIGDELVARSANHDAIFFSSGNKFTAEVIQALSDQVKVLATFSVGHEHIDLIAAKEKKLTVVNTPGVLNEATADTAFMLLLCASRRIIFAALFLLLKNKLDLAIEWSEMVIGLIGHQRKCWVSGCKKNVSLS